MGAERSPVEPPQRPGALQLSYHSVPGTPFHLGHAMRAGHGGPSAICAQSRKPAKWSGMKRSKRPAEPARRPAVSGPYASRSGGARPPSPMRCSRRSVSPDPCLSAGAGAALRKGNGTPADSSAHRAGRDWTIWRMAISPAWSGHGEVLPWATGRSFSSGRAEYPEAGRLVQVVQECWQGAPNLCTTSNRSWGYDLLRGEHADGR